MHMRGEPSLSARTGAHLTDSHNLTMLLWAGVQRVGDMVWIDCLPSLVDSKVRIVLESYLLQLIIRSSQSPWYSYWTTICLTVVSQVINCLPRDLHDAGLNKGKYVSNEGATAVSLWLSRRYYLQNTGINRSIVRSRAFFLGASISFQRWNSIPHIQEGVT